MNIHYKVNFFSDWHASSGLSGGAYADSLVIKENGFPYLPGKTVKGLLREASVKISSLSNGALVDEDFINDVFGVEPSPEQINQEIKTREGDAFFGNAYLSEAILSELEEKSAYLKGSLYQVRAFTKLDKAGIAAEGTLRQMEVCVPVTLYGEIDGFPNREGYLEQFKLCMQGIKRLGLNRSRGLGRCEFSIIKTA